MKKLLGIMVLGLLLGGNAYAEIIKFTKCAIERDNYIFDTESYERKEFRFDTTAKTVTQITEYTDKYIKKYGELKHYVSESKLDYIVDHLAGRTSLHNGEPIIQYVYDLEKKTYEQMDILANYKVYRFKCL
ncbi:hypothetical protein N9C51_05235 [Candidatus Pelagibacter sp.]|nr:hypothetical protein [Candidatus Pelagibacter sp.]